MTTKRKAESTAGVILCGGKGTRMGTTPLHKVCHPVAGRPSIVRLVDTLKADGVDPIIMVVGHRCGDVIETVGSAHADVQFVFQRDRLGTGHAARIGIEALARFGHEGKVLVTMGDKWLAPGVIGRLQRYFDKSEADLLAVGTAKRPESTAGRFVELPGKGVAGIVELRDIQRLRLLEEWYSLSQAKKPLTRAALRKVGLQHIRPSGKLWRALGPLARFAHGTGKVSATELAQAIQEAGLKARVGGKHLTAEQVEKRSKSVNESVYLAKTAALRSALQRVGRNNAQDEYYLTDVVEILTRDGEREARRRPSVVQYQLKYDEVMAFNTRPELRRIEKHVTALESGSRLKIAPKHRRCFKTIEQWEDVLGSRKGVRLVERSYGIGGPLVKERLQALRQVVQLFGRQFNEDGRVAIVRAPGRLNLMGRHIDHQGGYVHSMALDCEIVMAVRPRDDDVIRIINADGVSFPAREMVIGDWLGHLRERDWLGFVDGEAVATHLLSTAGDWSNYFLAPVLYQQLHHADGRLRGMDVAVSGNIPMAAGLSSSSALVVGAMEAICAVNGLDIDGAGIVSACGQAEWFVGSRGGAADHAAIRLARAGHVTRMGFHPFHLDRNVPIPPETSLLIAYSGEHAIKSAGARDRFNERVANYRLGILLLRQAFPKYARKLEYIRDVSPERLNCSVGQVLELIEALPEKISRAQLKRRLSGTDLDRIFASHSDPGQYTVRDVVRYGVAECERSRLAAGRLERGDVSGFGRMMFRSHDGDRVKGKAVSASDVDSSAGTELETIVGKYACSTANLDQLVDIAHSVSGVYGAQLAGAGLGGCVMILADQQAIRRVTATLTGEYFRPRGMSPAIWRVRSVHGGGLLRP